ncbi:uncharacterized protein METZ01_LOCUS426795, partial [marine metagenome]
VIENRTKKFIVLTAKENFWNIDIPILFLGEWCKKYSKKHIWNSLNAETMPTWIKTKNEVLDAINYVDDIYEKLLPCVANQLNNLHNENHSIRYWRILIGPWLLHHITIFYDRYMLIKKAVKMYPNFQTIGLHQDCYVVPSETINYINLSHTDEYNLQIFTDILSLMGYKIDRKKDYSYHRINSNDKFNFNIKFFLKQIITTTFNKISNILYKNNLLVLNKVYSPFSLITWLRIKTKGKLVYYQYDFKKKGMELGEINHDIRDKI